MVTQNGHRSVGTVVGEDLCWDVVIRCEGQESGEQVTSPGSGAPASVPQPLQNQPSPSMYSLNTAFQLQSQAWPLPSQPLTPSGCFSSPLTPQRGSTTRAGKGQQDHPAHLVKLQGARQHCSQGLWMSSQETQGCYTCMCLACHLQHPTINRKQTGLVKDRHNLESTSCVLTSQFCSAPVLSCPTTRKDCLTADFWSDLSCLTFALEEL